MVIMRSFSSYIVLQHDCHDSCGCLIKTRKTTLKAGCHYRFHLDAYMNPQQGGVEDLERA